MRAQSNAPMLTSCTQTSAETTWREATFKFLFDERRRVGVLRGMADKVKAEAQIGALGSVAVVRPSPLRAFEHLELELATALRRRERLRIQKFIDGTIVLLSLIHI